MMHHHQCYFQIKDQDKATLPFSRELLRGYKTLTGVRKKREEANLANWLTDNTNIGLLLCQIYREE